MDRTRTGPSVELVHEGKGSLNGKEVVVVMVAMVLVVMMMVVVVLWR